MAAPTGDLAGLDLATACTQVASWPQHRAQGYFWKASDNSSQYAGAMIADQATGPHNVLAYDYYGTPANFPVPANATLTTATTVANCTHCLTIYECTTDSPASCAPKFLGQAGTVSVTAATAATKGQFTATASNLRLYEWDFGNDKPVVPGRCYDVASASFSTPFNTPKSLIWYFGDFVTDGTKQLGQLDFYAAGGGIYSTFPSMSAWDVDGNGALIAFGANITVSTRYDLWIASYDGSSAKKIADMAAGGRVKAVKISPDAKKLAFIGDPTQAGLFDIYVVDLTATTPAPVKVSPARAGGTASDYEPELMAWSRDSKYLAFTGDFEANNKDGLFIVDTAVLSPAPTPVVAVAASDIAAAGTSSDHSGVLSNLEWTADAKLLFKANLTTGRTGYRLYRVDANGMNRVVLAKDASNVEYEVGAFGISPDGATVAFSAMTTGSTYELFKMPTSGASAPVNIFKTNGANFSPVAGRRISVLTPIWWSRDGNRIAFTADYRGVAGRFEPHTVASAGGAPVRVAEMPTSSAGWISWSPDSSTLAFTAPIRVAGNIEVYRVIDATTADQTPVLVMSVVSGGDFTFSGPMHNDPVRWTP